RAQLRRVLAQIAAGASPEQAEKATEPRRQERRQEIRRRRRRAAAEGAALSFPSTPPPMTGESLPSRWINALNQLESQSRSLCGGRRIGDKSRGPRPDPHN